MRQFSRPRLWLGIWVFGWLLCIVLSVIPPLPLGIDATDGDKLGHALAYATLSAWAVMLFDTTRGRWLAAASLVALGAALELAQGLLTDDRMMDWRDGVANMTGVMLGQCVAWTPLRNLLQRLDAHLFPRR